MDIDTDMEIDFTPPTIQFRDVPNASTAIKHELPPVTHGAVSCVCLYPFFSFFFFPF